MSYEDHKRRVANNAREQTTDARDIGKIPRPKNWQRLKACELDLRKYLLTHNAQSFPLPFSKDHESILKSIESKTLDGGLEAIAMSRGSGKTTILIRVGMSAPSYGHRRFLALIEAGGSAAVTVIVQGCTSDRMLNRKLSPKWLDRRCKIKHKWSESKLWDKYL